MLRKEPRNTEAPHINIQSPKMTSQYIKFSHKKKYCGIKDIRVLFYSSIFQMIIVFPFIVLKYFSFCCYSSHSILFWNPLVYSCFVLFVKRDSKLNQNSSCQLSILFYLFVTHLCLQPVFFHFYDLTSLISDCFFLCILSLLLLCLFYYFVFLHFVFPVTLSLCHFFFPIILLYIILSFLLFCLFYYFVFMSFCLFSSFCRTSSPLFSFSFWLHFYSFICLFFDIFA